MSRAKPELETKGDAIQATKYDYNKPRMALVPRRALAEVAKVFTYGANQDPRFGPINYEVGNWHAGNGFDWDRLQSASLRHDNDFALGQDLDPESHLHHLAHKICCDMMLLEHALTGLGNDNRVKTQYIPSQEKVDAHGSTESIPVSGNVHQPNRTKRVSRGARRRRVGNRRTK